jgi:hypothetical protein
MCWGHSLSFVTKKTTQARKRKDNSINGLKTNLSEARKRKNNNSINGLKTNLRGETGN